MIGVGGKNHMGFSGSIQNPFLLHPASYTGYTMTALGKRQIYDQMFRKHLDGWN